MKTCHKCKESKNESEFNKNRSRDDGLQAKCRLCDQERAKQYYQGSQVQQKAAIERNKVRMEECKNKICEYLNEHPCVDCGETDILTLEFDHEDPSKKRDGICELLRNRHGWRTLQAEIDKCSVRCANCHRRRTAKQFANYRLKWLDNGAQAIAVNARA